MGSLLLCIHHVKCPGHRRAHIGEPKCAVCQKAVTIAGREMESGDIVKYLRSTGERKILKPVYLRLLLWHSPRPDPSSEWLQGFEPFIKNRNLRGGKEAMSFRLDSTEPPVLSEVLLRVQNAYLGFLLRCHLPWTWRRCRPCLAVSSQKAATGRKFRLWWSPHAPVLDRSGAVASAASASSTVGSFQFGCPTCTSATPPQYMMPVTFSVTGIEPNITDVCIHLGIMLPSLTQK